MPGHPDLSFEIFTAQIGRWWSLAGRHSVFGDGGTVEFADGRLVETSAAGETSICGEVLEWAPGALLRLCWRPGGAPERATEVRVRFESVDTAEGRAATLVTPEHQGWERTDDADSFRAGYEKGSPIVIGRFGAQAVNPQEAQTSGWTKGNRPGNPRSGCDLADVPTHCRAGSSHQRPDLRPPRLRRACSLSREAR
ncbi:uncharacterized protein YndB with AHSA1/START domain [Nakamurella sp. UYEF19]|uniref:SRPBCC domain-containing protein n=1 Tax=Nakamurella sp. UYEF19 TaxID=1756392 RepID=UPI00339371D1